MFSAAIDQEESSRWINKRLQEILLLQANCEVMDEVSSAVSDEVACSLRVVAFCHSCTAPGRCSVPWLPVLNLLLDTVEWLRIVRFHLPFSVLEDPPLDLTFSMVSYRGDLEVLTGSSATRCWWG